MDFLPDIEKFKNFFDGTDSKNEISIAVEEAKKYDIFNLISRVSALNLFHQNQTKSVILDTYIEGVLCQTTFIWGFVKNIEKRISCSCRTNTKRFMGW